MLIGRHSLSHRYDIESKTNRNQGRYPLSLWPPPTLPWNLRLSDWVPVPIYPESPVTGEALRRKHTLFSFYNIRGRRLCYSVTVCAISFDGKLDLDLRGVCVIRLKASWKANSNRISPSVPLRLTAAVRRVIKEIYCVSVFVSTRYSTANRRFYFPWGLSGWICHNAGASWKQLRMVKVGINIWSYKICFELLPVLWKKLESMYTFTLSFQEARLRTLWISFFWPWLLFYLFSVQSPSQISLSKF